MVQGADEIEAAFADMASRQAQAVVVQGIFFPKAIADLAILDGRVLLEASTDRKAATRLLRYYLASDKPVLVLAEGTDADFSFEDDRVAIATRVNRTSVVEAVRELLELDTQAA